MTLLKVKLGHFETAMLILHNLFVFYYSSKRCVFCTVMQLFNGSYFSVGVGVGATLSHF